MRTDPHSSPSRAAHRAALMLMLALVLLCVAWELWIAPLRAGGSWLVLKALPLAVLVPGVARADLKQMQVAVLVVLAYVAEGAVRAVDGWPVSVLAVAELVLAAAFFIASLAYLAPFTRAARARSRRDVARG